MHRILANPPRPIMLALALSLTFFAGCSDRPVASPTSGDAPPKAVVTPVAEARVEAKPPAKESATSPGDAPEGMVWIPGGTFMMGTDDATLRDASPRHEVTLDGF